AYRAALAHPEVRGEAFNAGPAEVITNRDLAFRVASIIDYPEERIACGAYPPDYPTRPFASDQPAIHLDASKIEARLGWRPTVDLHEGLRKTVDVWRQKTG
ncbi:MAG: hypothetical protein AAF492_05355, partial [Verrucomicrobiota bacterium]